jgi:hypothetical protein
MDIGGWLRNLGLEKYEAVLRDNEIDDAVLPKLTEDHLRELGFPLGARLKLLDAHCRARDCASGSYDRTRTTVNRVRYFDHFGEARG